MKINTFILIAFINFTLLGVCNAQNTLNTKLLTPLNNKAQNYFCEKTFDGIITKEGFKLNDSVYGEMRLYEEGKLITVMNFINEELNGPYASYFYSTGNIYLRGSHKNGKKEGIWKEYDVNGHFKLHKYNADEEVFLTKKDSVEALSKHREYSSQSNNQTIEPFKYVIENTFALSSGEVQVTGKVVSGKIKEGETIGINKNGKEIKTKTNDMQIFSKFGTTAIKGDDVTFVFKGISKSDLTRGDTLIKISK